MTLRGLDPSAFNAAGLPGAGPSRTPLTHHPQPRYTHYMAHDFLIFDFGSDEETAQQARRKVENWIQGFRLGKKMILKYEREDAETEAPDEGETSSEKSSARKKKTSGKSNDEPAGNVRVLIRLDFSDHEKLSHQRWLDRIPTEEPFKAKKVKIVRQSDPQFGETAELFDNLS
jgi:hypothetical protein